MNVAHFQLSNQSSDRQVSPSKPDGGDPSRLLADIQRDIRPPPPPSDEMADTKK